jgi:hypothetical protein
MATTYTVEVPAYNIETGEVEKFLVDCTHADFIKVYDYCKKQLDLDPSIYEYRNIHDWGHKFTF